MHTHTKKKKIKYSVSIDLNCQWPKKKFILPVVGKVDNAIHWINLYPLDSTVCLINTYALNSDLSVA